MFEEASNRITVWLSKTKIISSDQEVVCKWGMTHILDTLFNIATFTAIGLLFRMLPATAKNLRHLMGLRKSLSTRIEVCVRKAGRNKAVRKVILAHILLCFQSLTMSLIICTLTASTARSVRFA